MNRTTTLALAAFTIALLLAPLAQAAAPYSGWQHSGSLYVITTPQGADLPATAAENGFPLLVRLNDDFFDFSEAKANGEDIRFAAGDGAPLPYQIDHWDAAKATAAVWVRIPTIKGNARQEIKMFWGKADAANESNGKAVFNESNGFLSVWHMNDPVHDEVGTVASKDEGTTATAGIIGQARHFAGRQGISGGQNITAYPSGVGPMTTEAWFRPEKTNSTVLAWGKEQRPGKVMMNFLSPPRVAIQCYFADVEAKSPLAVDQWYHVVHTYRNRDSRVYVNGRLDGASTPLLDIPKTSGLWIGGWYGNYNFVGDVDEVRISKIVRSADWIRMEYENQKPLKTLVGSLVKPGTGFGVCREKLDLAEGRKYTVVARAGGAEKVYWILNRDGRETVVAVDRLFFTFHAGRVAQDESLTLQFKAVYADAVKTIDIPVTIKKTIPDPAFTLKAPARWDGRETIELAPQIANLQAMQDKDAGDLKYDWTVSGLAVTKQIAPGKLILKRAQNSGTLSIKLDLSNGGAKISSTVAIAVAEPEHDAWVERTPDKDEKPVENQFYARDDKNEGTLYYNGTLPSPGDSVAAPLPAGEGSKSPSPGDSVAAPLPQAGEGSSVFLKLYADEKLIKTESRKLAADRSYAFTVKLKPGLIRYKVEFGMKTGGMETVLHTADNLVCGDAFLIDGQSNALATDTGEKSPPETSDWIRTYGHPSGDPKGAGKNLWCNAVWKGQRGEKAELGWWGMELAKRLVASQKMPICIINAAAGGTRIDQHQRKEDDPEDLKTIYGRMLWRVRQARLTHGIRGVLWHQGEADQGADGPDGGYGWQTYRQYFLNMSAAWKEDMPNIRHYYIFQIWPNGCSQGGGPGDMLREVQRTLPRLYSNMDVMSTLGIKPPGGCHYPLTGWSEFARLMQPLIERDFYGKVPDGAVTPPNLQRAYYAGSRKDTVALEFDQPIVWTDALAGEFYLDGAKGEVASGSVSGNVIMLKLKQSSAATKITYLKEMSWSQDRLLRGANGIAALTFCEVPIGR